MARPTPLDIEAGQEAWDTIVQFNFDLIFVTPTRIAEYAEGELPDAAEYQGCIVSEIISGTSTLKFSNGSAWKTVTVT